MPRATIDIFFITAMTTTCLASLIGGEAWAAAHQPHLLVLSAGAGFGVCAMRHVLQRLLPK